MILAALSKSFVPGEDAKNIVNYVDEVTSENYLSKDGKFVLTHLWHWEGPNGGQDKVPGSYLTYDGADTHLGNNAESKGLGLFYDITFKITD